MGLNRLMHFALGSEHSWHNLGDKLVPKEPWKQVLDQRPGLRTVEIIAQQQEGSVASVMVKVQPSVLVQWGAYFEVNEHYPASEQPALKEYDGYSQRSMGGDAGEWGAHRKTHTCLGRRLEPIRSTRLR